VKQSINPSGVNHDIAPVELGFESWSDLRNVVFNNGFAESTPGFTTVMAGALFRPLWTIPLYTATNFYWLYVGNNTAETAGGIGVTDGTTHFDITPAGGWSVMKAGDITGGVLNGVPFLNNGIEPPVFWDGVTANICTTLPGWDSGTRAKAMRPFKYHIVAMNITDASGDFPDLVIWSAAADPGTIPQEWAPTPENEAGNFSIASTTGAIIDGGQMRDQFMVYKNHSSTIMQYIAGQFVFSNRKAFVTSGILARNCYQELYGQHYVITDSDFIQHNGQEVKSLIDGKNRNWLFDQIDPLTFQGSFLAASHNRKQLWISFPRSGATFCDQALVYDIKSDEFGVSDLPNVPYIARGIIPDPGIGHNWDAQTESWNDQIVKWNQQLFNPTSDALLMCNYLGEGFYVQAGFTQDGAPIEIMVQLLSKDMGEPQRRKLIQAVWTLVESAQVPGTGNTRVRIGSQELINDDIKWSASQSIADGKANFMESGRYMSLEITATQLNAWRLSSMDIDYNLQGMW
jgi:hypothetical protein